MSEPGEPSREIRQVYCRIVVEGSVAGVVLVFGRDWRPPAVVDPEVGWTTDTDGGEW